MCLLDSSDTKLLEAASSAMREALRKLAEVHCNLFGELTESDLQVGMISSCTFTVDVYVFICCMQVSRNFLTKLNHL
jgi:hypothetical protein